MRKKSDVGFEIFMDKRHALLKSPVAVVRAPRTKRYETQVRFGAEALVCVKELVVRLEL